MSLSLPVFIALVQRSVPPDDRDTGLKRGPRGRFVLHKWAQ